MLQEPIRTRRYRLTRADALAYETSRPLRGWRIWAFIVWLALAGAELALLPEDWIAGWMFWAVGAALVGLHYLVSIAVRTLLAHWRAARRVPVPVPVAVEMEEWGDHLCFRIGDRNLVLAHETIAATALTADHLFIHAPPELVIIPRVAFADPGEPEALAALIEDSGRES